MPTCSPISTSRSPRGNEPTGPRNWRERIMNRWRPSSAAIGSSRRLRSMRNIKHGVIGLCLLALLIACSTTPTPKEIVEIKVPADRTVKTAPPRLTGNTNAALEGWAIDLLEWGRQCQGKLDVIRTEYGQGSDR